MSVESVTQAVSDLALAFSDQDDEVYAMVIKDSFFGHFRVRSESKVANYNYNFINKIYPLLSIIS
jgi:hypothetical protein